VSRSAQEPEPEKPYPFLLTVSLRASHHPDAEVKVLEYKDPTASRHMVMHELAMVRTRVDAAHVSEQHKPKSEICRVTWGDPVYPSQG